MTWGLHFYGGVPTDSAPNKLHTALCNRGKHASDLSDVTCLAACVSVCTATVSYNIAGGSMTPAFVQERKVLKALNCQVHRPSAVALSAAWFGAQEHVMARRASTECVAHRNSICRQTKETHGILVFASMPPRPILDRHMVLA